MTTSKDRALAALKDVLAELRKRKVSGLKVGDRGGFAARDGSRELLRAEAAWSRSALGWGTSADVRWNVSLVPTRRTATRVAIRTFRHGDDGRFNVAAIVDAFVAMLAAVKSGAAAYDAALADRRSAADRLAAAAAAFAARVPDTSLQPSAVVARGGAVLTWHLSLDGADYLLNLIASAVEAAGDATPEEDRGQAEED